MFCRVKVRHAGTRHRFPTCFPWSPSPECSRMRHLDVKNNFIAGLCSVDKDFPLHLWDHLLPQAVLTLNLLCGPRLNRKLSAWAQLSGNFDFNHTPLSPPACVSWFTKNRTNDRHGHIRALMGGMLVQRSTRIAATSFGSVILDPCGPATLSHGFQPKCQYPLHLPMTESLQASKIS